MSELHGDKSGFESTQILLNFGARQKLTEEVILLIAAGTAVSGAPMGRTHVRLFVGLQLNLPHVYTTHN
jgi:hypothetical protein